MPDVSQSVVAQLESSPDAPRTGDHFSYALAALVWEATWMYRLGGFTGILFGLSASALSYQIRRMGAEHDPLTVASTLTPGKECPAGGTGFSAQANVSTSNAAYGKPPNRRMAPGSEYFFG